MTRPSLSDSELTSYAGKFKDAAIGMLQAAIVIGLIALVMVLVSPRAEAQTAGVITFIVEQTTANGSTTPKLTWSTAPVATDCVASGDWTGAKGGAGTETRPSTNVSRTYNLTCTWSDTKATLTWTLPTLNTDGSSYTDPKGFVISYGTSAGALTQTLNVLSPTATSQVITPASAGTWYFAIASMNQRDAVGPQSPVVSKVIGSASGSKSVGVTVLPVPNAPGNVVAN